MLHRWVGRPALELGLPRGRAVHRCRHVHGRRAGARPQPRPAARVPARHPGPRRHRARACTAWPSMERARAAAVPGRPPAGLAASAAVPGAGWVRAAARRTGRREVWKEAAYCLLLLPVAVVSAVQLVLAFWSVAFAGLLAARLRRPAAGRRGLSWLHWSTARGRGRVRRRAGPRCCWPACCRPGLAAAQLALARALLAPSDSDALRAQVSPAAPRPGRRVVDAADAERRRIERDLHDGAQQRLVVAGHEPRQGQGEARRPTRRAPASCVDQAHHEAKDALTELRDLVRGVHPAVLTDRGLDAALSGAGRPLAGPGAAATSTCRERPSPDGRGDRLLRRGRGADQRRQARRARPGPSVHVERDGDRLLRRRHRRRPRRRRPRPRGTGLRRAAPTGWPRVDGTLHV